MRRYPSWKELQKITNVGRFAAGDGLYMQVGPGGTRSWIFRYRRGDKSYHLGLGSCRYLSLVEARQKAIDAQRQRLAGLDPLIEKRKAKQPVSLATNVPTFERAALQFISEREPSWRNGASAYQWRLSLRKYVFPHLGQRVVSDITTADVLAVLKPIWTTVPETARRVRNRVELIMSYAIAHRWRSADNPATWQILKNLLPDLKGNGGQRHFAAVPYKEMPALMARLRQDDCVVSKALQFCILTAARPSEAASARWDEIQDGVWVIPPSRMKRNREHRVPLSIAAGAVLAGLPRLGDAIFPGARKEHVGSGSLLKLLKSLGRGETVHGCRSAFSTWACECTRHPDHLVELALAHTVGGAVERAYRRSDLFEARRVLMEDWANFLNSGTKPA